MFFRFSMYIIKNFELDRIVESKTIQEIALAVKSTVKFFYCLSCIELSRIVNIIVANRETIYHLKTTILRTQTLHPLSKLAVPSNCGKRALRELQMCLATLLLVSDIFRISISLYRL
jgi:hypothetical protein